MAISLASALLGRCSERKSGSWQSCKRDREKTMGVYDAAVGVAIIAFQFYRQAKF